MTGPGARQGDDETPGCGGRESMSRGVLNNMDVGGSGECVREQPMCWTRPELQSGNDGQAQKVRKWTTHIDVAVAAASVAADAAAEAAAAAGDVEKKRKGRTNTDREDSFCLPAARPGVPSWLFKSEMESITTNWAGR